MRVFKMMSRAEEGEYPARVTAVSFREGDTIAEGDPLYELALADGRVVRVKSSVAGQARVSPLPLGYVLEGPEVILEVQEVPAAAEPEDIAPIVEEIAAQDDGEDVPATPAEAADPAPEPELEAEETAEAADPVAEPAPEPEPEAEETAEAQVTAAPDTSQDHGGEGETAPPKPRNWRRLVSLTVLGAAVIGAAVAFAVIPHAGARLMDVSPFGTKIPSVARISLAHESYGAIGALTAHNGTIYAVAYGAPPGAQAGKGAGAGKTAYLAQLTRASDGRYDWDITKNAAIDALQARLAFRDGFLYSWGETRIDAADTVRQSQLFRVNLAGPPRSERVHATGLVPASAVPVAVALDADGILQLRAAVQLDPSGFDWIGDAPIYVATGPTTGPVDVTRFGAFFGATLRDGSMPERMHLAGVRIMPLADGALNRFAVFGTLARADRSEAFVQVFTETTAGAWSSADHRMPPTLVAPDGALVDAPFSVIRDVQMSSVGLTAVAEFGNDAQRTSGTVLLRTADPLRDSALEVLGLDPLSLNPEMLERDRVRFVGATRLADQTLVLATRRTRVTEDAAEYSLVALDLSNARIVAEMQWRDPDTRRGSPGLERFGDSQVMLYNIGEAETRIEIIEIQTP